MSTVAAFTALAAITAGILAWFSLHEGQALLEQSRLVRSFGYKDESVRLLYKARRFQSTGYKFATAALFCAICTWVLA